MRTAGWFAAWTVLLCGLGAPAAGAADLEYPCALRDAYDADDSCWVGMSLSGEYPVPVIPEQWLVGPPPSEMSAVTMPTDHWVELLYRGRIVDADGNDVLIREWGKAGEETIVFLTDGADQEFPIALAKADLAMQAVSYIYLDLPDVFTPFAPRGLRLVAVDSGGGAPGFDVASVQARVLRACGSRADDPVPIDGAANVARDVTLAWTPACDAIDQSLYLGDSRRLVESADPSVRLALLPSDVNCFEPNGLALNTTYYWRVDANGAGTGEVWSFTTVDHIVIEDFDSYGISGGYLYETWHTRGKARVGEESFQARRSCPQCMRFAYYYDNVHLSETYRDLCPAQDWTQAGAQSLAFWLYGMPGNDMQGRMYAVLSDGTADSRVTYDGDKGILTSPEWNIWRIPLADFNGVDLSAVCRLTLGFVFPSAQSGQYGSGTIYVDDICLYSSLCLEEHRSAADLTADCRVDYRDLGQMATQWLQARGPVVDVVAPGEPVLWYAFDGNTQDSAGRTQGLSQGRPTFEIGVHGRAIHMVNRGDAVVVSNASAVFEGIREAITIAFWQRGDDSGHRNDTLCCSDYAYGQTNPSIAVHLGCWRDAGQYRWDCGTPWSFANRLAGRHHCRYEWTGRWNHWAFTKDTAAGPGGKGLMCVYLNGVLYDSRSGTSSPIERIKSFQIGSGWYGHYDGLIDDFQIYDYALSEAEVAYLASDGTGRLPWDSGLAADLDGSSNVDFGDFAILADEWLESQLWP